MSKHLFFKIRLVHSALKKSVEFIVEYLCFIFVQEILIFVNIHEIPIKINSLFHSVYICNLHCLLLGYPVAFWWERDYIKHCKIEQIALQVCSITMYIYLTVQEFLTKTTKYSRIQVFNLIVCSRKINANNLYTWEGISSVAQLDEYRFLLQLLKELQFYSFCYLQTGNYLER